jgi:acyl-coenzyme A synthetase/AMP-(fatty) acid ligase
MSDIAGALASRGGREVIRFGGERIGASAVLERADHLSVALGAPEGRLILSMDPSPATLLALLVVVERYGCCLMLGRASIDMAALGVRPDWIVHRPEHVERVAAAEGCRGDAGSALFLLTSGTTGTPKVVHQTLPAILGRVLTGSTNKNRDARWLLTFETHSFAGLQVVLSAAVGDGLLVVPESRNPASLTSLARACEVTHISGTPTFWRSLLMATGEDGLPALRQITIGGEAVDQATLDRLLNAFPAARLSHIYASTEAGSLFAVNDGRAGFPRA